MSIRPIAKAIVAGIALVAEAVVVAGADNVINMTEGQHVIVSAVTAVVGIYTVWKVSNAPKSVSSDLGD